MSKPIYLLVVLGLLFGAVAMAATRSIVPQAAHEGQIGTTNLPWAAAYFDDVYVGSYKESILTMPGRVGLFDSMGVFLGSGTSVVFQSPLYAVVSNGSIYVDIPDYRFPTNLIGNSRAVYNFSTNVQTFTVPAGVSNLAIWAWGGGGAGDSGNYYYGGAGAFVYGLFSVIGGEVLTLGVAEGGPMGIANGLSRRAFGGGGPSLSFGATNIIAGAGGGATWVRYGSTGEYMIVSAGGSGSPRGTASSGAAPGGANSGTDGGSVNGPGSYSGNGASGTNGGTTYTSYAGWPSGYAYTNTAGSFLLAGLPGYPATSSTGNVGIAGAGSGYYGGGGGLVGLPPSSGQNYYSSGGSGNSYLAPFVISGYRSGGYKWIPMGQDQAEYISGVAYGNGATNGGPGLVVFGY